STGSRRTYGSNRRPTSNLRGGSAHSSKGALFGSQTASGLGDSGGQHGSTRVGLSLTYEEEAKSPHRGSLSSALSPGLGFDSSPIEQAFVKRGQDLGLESPGYNTSGPPAAPSKAAGGRRGGGKAKKPAATRARRGANRAQATAAARGPSADPGNDREAAAEEDKEARAPAPKRKVPAGRKTRTAKQAGGGGSGTAVAPIEILTDEASGEEGGVGTSGTERRRRPHASPSARRDRSPTRRGAGRPDRWADRGGGGGGGGAAAGSAAARKPSSPLSSPLRPITNYTSEGDRPPRTKAKVRSLTRKISGGNSGGVYGRTSGGGGGDISSSDEEEWRDDGMDFTKRFSAKGRGNGGSGRDGHVKRETKEPCGRRSKLEADGRNRRRRQGDNEATRAVAVPATRGKKSDDRDTRAAAAADTASRAAKGDGLLSDGLGSARSERSHGEDVEEFDEGGEEQDLAEVCLAPPPLLSPGGPTSAEVKLSLDSSAEGILVGDKRRRGSGRGKGGARVAEDTAHRSSRSRHLSPLVPVSGGLVKHGFSVEEEGDSEVDAALMDATPEEDDDEAHDGLDDFVADLPQPTPPPRSSSLAALAQIEWAPTTAPTAPHPRSGALKRSHDSAPALAMTTSPALGLHKQGGRDTLVVTHAEVELWQATSAENLAERGWGNESPPARLSRSLSSSQATAPAAWIGAGGCAKVSRSSFRRRSRANSTSSPLPVLETSASMPTGGSGVGLADATAGGDWTSRSFGSAGFPRHGRRRSHGGVGVGGDDESLRTKSMCEASSALHRNPPLSRSHRMPFWNKQVGNGNGLKSVGRPISLPSGITRKLGSGDKLPVEEAPAVDGGDRDGNGGGGGGGGEPGFGWVLRSPGAPLDDRRRSQSFAGAGARSTLERSKSESIPSSSYCSAGGARQRPPGLAGASGDEYGLSDAWMGRGLDGQQEQEPELGAGDEDDEDMAPARTPQGSQLGTSAALHRAHGLSSVARRMDRLEIRSPNIESHAAQAQMEIMANPMGDQPDHSSAVAASLDGSDGTPVRPCGISLPCHRTPVGNWNPTKGRSRLSGAGGSPTECFRDYLSGCQGGEEEEEEE
ncbi:unnamed protein product, partial [Hapterophycus canaliculatus]